MTRYLALAVAALVTIGPAAHAETMSARQAQKDWKSEDECFKHAFEINHDHTADANRWRDRYVKDCKMHKRQVVPSTSAPLLTAPPPKR